MKTKKLESIVALFMVTMTNSLAETPIPMQGIDPESPRFAGVYEKVLKIREQNRNPRAFEVIQKISDGKFLVRERKAVTAVVGDALSRIGRGGKAAAVPKLAMGDFFWMPHEEPLADGEAITGFYSNADEVVAYTGVTGAKHTVRKLEKDPPYTKDAFVAELKAGAIYKYEVVDEIKCAKCKGVGRFIRDGRQKGVNGIEPCGECKGTGKKTTTYAIQW